MVAYSFKPQFRAPILAGTKRQTIRADRRRHAREGEQLQLYTCMRTRQCCLIGRAACRSVEPIRIEVEAGTVETPGMRLSIAARLDEFARLDGFEDWADMRAFWRAAHRDAPVFSGVLICWTDFRVGDANA